MVHRLDIFTITHKIKNDEVHYYLNGNLLCSPTITEKKVIEAKTGKTYEECLIEFLETNDITDYNATIIAMKIFEKY